ncbi:SIMPL domain-containing protein [Catenuloplanes atrovinosus]|uniref:Uncharacterized protein YggE n=1 Tax=Catenuloplanes atrovinosus TaxID=137266 RepID=A0AAE3YRH2_9ACTN|nr:SIMPL domain-containing protein [Catenuloplanes atrovinosus]MDR7277113.1 uncharacterized protein YggE [Catenuloplanes atrovinosus]
MRVALATLLLAAAWLPAAPAHASTTAPPVEGVVVTGTGEAYGEPDTAAVSLAVETSAPTVAKAMDDASAAAVRMRDALLRAGVARADLRTSDVTVDSTVDDEQKVTGYSARYELDATVRDLPKAGAIMSAAIAAGGDAARLDGVSFVIEDSAAVLAKARQRAFADARAKAELYAHQAGRALDRVVRVTEDAPGHSGADKQSYALGAGAADAAVPIEPGTQALTATVTVEWSFTDPR